MSKEGRGVRPQIGGKSLVWSFVVVVEATETKVFICRKSKEECPGGNRE